MSHPSDIIILSRDKKKVKKYQKVVNDINKSNKLLRDRTIKDKNGSKISE